MDRVAVILGAGASTPFFDPPLTTNALTSAVCDVARWTDLLQRYTQVAQTANRIDQQVIIDLLAKLGAAGPNWNFEDYIEVADKVASYACDPSNDKILHSVINILQGQLDSYGGHRWTTVPFLFRQVVAERIQEAQEEHRVQNYELLVQRFGDFLCYLSKESELSVVSFNYDDVVFDALESVELELEDGFKNDYYEASDYLRGDSVLAFPHGHARFVLEKNRFRRYLTIGEANSKRLNNLYGDPRHKTRYLLNGQNCYNFNTFMVTGRDKDSTFNENPFAAYYQRLACDLLTAELVILAGFSLQDPHICRLLLNFRRLRETNRVFVIDFNPGSIDFIPSYTDSSSLINRLLDTVDVQSIPASGNEYKFQPGVHELNDTGVGVVYPQISLCKLGFEGFLRDYQAILQRACNL